MELKRPIEIVITGRQYFGTTDLFFSPEKPETEGDEMNFVLPEKNERMVELSTFGELVICPPKPFRSITSALLPFRRA